MMIDHDRQTGTSPAGGVFSIRKNYNAYHKKHCSYDEVLCGKEVKIQAVKVFQIWH